MVPLEDQYVDVLAKAQTGLSWSDKELSKRAGVEPSVLQDLKSGLLDEGVLIKVAEALELRAAPLLDLAKSRYRPAPIAEIEGMASFNSAFHDMTVNAFLVWDPSTKEAACFDTGSDGQAMWDFATARRLNVTQIFITHIHTDHIFDLDWLLEKTRARAWVCEREPLAGVDSFSPGRVFHIGGLVVETLLTTGHSVGGVTYFIKGLSKPLAIVGDSIFAGSMGGGRVSYTDALRNNREKVLTLPEETIICPGHGPLTTVGEQKRSNPFFA